MQVSELFRLTNWIADNVVQTNIRKSYAQLIAKLQTNSDPGQQRVPFEDEKDTLTSKLRAVPLEQLTLQQIQALDGIGLLPVIGDTGAERVERILVGSGLDIASALQKIKDMAAAVESSVGWASDLSPRIKGIAAEVAEDPEVGEIILRVRFSGGVAISNVQDLKKWTAIWWDITRGIAMAQGKAPEDIRVVGASNGSILFWLAAGYGFTKLAAGIVNEVLKVAERTQSIRLKAEEIRGMRLANDAAEKALLNEVEETKKDAVATITNNVITNVYGQIEQNGDVANALTKSIEKLLNFLESGGEIDFVMPEPESSEAETDEEQTGDQTMVEEQRALRQLVHEVRARESSIKQLELFPKGS